MKLDSPEQGASLGLQDRRESLAPQGHRDPKATGVLQGSVEIKVIGVHLENRDAMVFRGQQENLANRDRMGSRACLGSLECWGDRETLENLELEGQLVRSVPMDLQVRQG